MRTSLREAWKSEDFSIEERRTTPKEEKQRLKEVSRQIRKESTLLKEECSSPRWSKMMLPKVANAVSLPFKTSFVAISRLNHRLFQVFCAQRFGRRSSRHGKELPLSLVNATNKLYDDKEQEEPEQENGENEIESSIDEHNRNTNEMMRIPQITTEELQTAVNKLKNMENHQTATGFEQKTSKLVARRRKKW